MTPLSHVLAYNSTAFPILTHFMRVFNLQNMFIMPFTDNLNSRIFFNKKALALILKRLADMHGFYFVVFMSVGRVSWINLLNDLWICCLTCSSGLTSSALVAFEASKKKLQLNVSVEIILSSNTLNCFHACKARLNIKHAI